MKLFSQSSELRAIKSITSRPAKAKKVDRYSAATVLNLDPSSFLLSNLDASFFHYEPCKVAYERILVMVKKRSTFMTYADLLEDLSLNEEFRDILREYTKKPVADMEQATTLFETLGKYRKARILYFSAKHILDKLKSSEIDVDLILDETANSITEARTQSLDRDPVLIMGKDSNCDDLLARALSKDDDILLKTGFVEFDTRTGGMPSEGVLLLAGTTSGGKSTLRMNLLKNMYRLNKTDVATVSFEMNDKKESRRLLSCITGIPFWKFTKNLLTAQDEKLCEKAFANFNRFGRKNDCRYALMCPTRGLSIEQVFMLMAPYGFKVIAIDYVSLLDGVDEDNQARLLKSIVRAAKIFSGNEHCLVVLLAQLDSDANHIRYSRGMLEDADACWQWNYTAPEDRDRKRLPIKQKKARDGEIYDFELTENFAMMQVLNTEEAIETYSESKDKPYRKPQPEKAHDDPLGDTSIEYAVD